MFPQSLNFQPVNTEQYCTSGDVTIFPGAAIAPGVLLQADVGSRIVIRAGVCIGLGSVIHASHGTITINDGANLGAGVLLIGDVTIGARACLGSAVTVINSAVAARAILESGLVVGDRSRRESIDDILDDIPMNSDQQTVRANPVSTNPAATHPVSASSIGDQPVSTHSTYSDPIPPVANSFQTSNGFYSPNNSAHPIAPTSTDSTPDLTPNLTPDLTPNLTVATPDVPSIPALSSTPIVSTFKYPEEPSLDISTPGIVLDNSGKPWQTCDPNPWDPTDRPPGETTCQITSKPNDPTPYNPTLFSSQTTASPYPPYPQNPPLSTDTVSTFKYPEPIAHTIAPAVTPTATPAVTPTATPEPPIAEPATPSEPKAVYGQDYVNRMLGKLSGR